MIRISSKLEIDENDVQFTCMHASGPGGQHVNKASTAVQLRFDVGGCSSLPEAVKERLRRQQAHRITASGELVLEAKRHRQQSRNKADALDRLRRLILLAAAPPKTRKASRPTRSSREKRLTQKREQSEKKQRRRRPDW